MDIIDFIIIVFLFVIIVIFFFNNFNNEIFLGIIVFEKNVYVLL